MSIEELLERQLNSGQITAGPNADPDALLMEMFRLCRRLERCSDKSAMLKCLRPDGSLYFLHKSRPRFNPRIRITTASSGEECEESDERDQNGNQDTSVLRLRVRMLCLKQAKEDLEMPDLKNIPWRRLVAIGWPQGINFHLDTPPLRKDELEELEALFNRKKIRFFWK